MINEDKKRAIYTLYLEGKGKREIARIFNIDPKTVRRIAASLAEGSDRNRRDKVSLDHDLLEQAYKDCDGYIQRVHEKLNEDHQISIGYSTLTRLLREMGIGQAKNQRCHKVPDEPGVEMQHDTSPYKLKIDDKITNVICSGLYFRYSKMRYIRFYRSFNRFNMKSFMYEALKHFGYSADQCVIDNTNLAVWYGTGPAAVFKPEMNHFAKNLSFKWLAHKIRHSNRKAGTERNFWTIETNFFPGRKFKSMSDLNKQAFDWATDLYAKRPLSKTKLIPVELFEIEKPYLNRLSSCIQPPYLEHERSTDQYGYIAFKANYYWIPGSSREKKLKIIEYPDLITIFKKREKLIEYKLPDDEVKLQRFSPEGIKTNPYEPSSRTLGSDKEEQQLRQKGAVAGKYLDYIKSSECRIRFKHQFIRELFFLSKKMAQELFINTIERALMYRVVHVSTLKKISIQLLKEGVLELSNCGDTLPELDDEDYQKRESYHKGRFSNEADLKSYDDLLDNHNDEDDNDNSND